MLNSIPIFYLSFMKMPIKVWRKIVRIQIEFLWGGVMGGRKISWERCKLVFQPKDKDGLGVRDMGGNIPGRADRGLRLILLKS